MNDAIDRKLDQILLRLSAGDDKRMTALVGLFSSIEQNLAEILERGDKDSVADSIAKLATALEAMKPSVTVAAPQVTVAAPEVRLEAVMPAINIPPAAAPVVHVMPSPSGDARFSVEFVRSDRPSRKRSTPRNG